MKFLRYKMTESDPEAIKREIREEFEDHRDLVELVAKSDTPLSERAAAVLEIIDQEDEEA